MTEDDDWILANEFAQVGLRVDRRGNDPRLRIEDLNTGRSVFLDPLVLAALVRVTEDVLARLVDPELATRTRAAWRAE